jgi:hypothetical protein
MAEPMASSLSVMELTVPTTANSTCSTPTAQQGAPQKQSEAAPPKRLADAWADAQWAWYPDAAYVVCGRPGHYRVSGACAGFELWAAGSACALLTQPFPPTHQNLPPPSTQRNQQQNQGCLVWGEPKTGAILDALARPSGRGAATALAFAYGRHPADAALLGRRGSSGGGGGAAVQLLVEVAPREPREEDLWCRLPGAELQRPAAGGLAAHHQQRMEETRRRGRPTPPRSPLASSPARVGCCPLASPLSPAASDGGSTAPVECDAAWGGCAEPAATQDDAGGLRAGCPTASLPRLAVVSAATAASGSPCGSVRGASPPYLPPGASPFCISREGGCPAGRADSSTDGSSAASPAAGARPCGSLDNASSPFASQSDQGEEEWEEEFLILACGGW